jgi:hypothetical protein
MCAEDSVALALSARAIFYCWLQRSVASGKMPADEIHH